MGFPDDYGPVAPQTLMHSPLDTFTGFNECLESALKTTMLFLGPTISSREGAPDIICELVTIPRDDTEIIRAGEGHEGGCRSFKTWQAS